MILNKSDLVNRDQHKLHNCKFVPLQNENIDKTVTTSVRKTDFTETENLRKTT